MTWRKSYERWKQTENLDPELKERLAELEGMNRLLRTASIKTLNSVLAECAEKSAPGRIA